MGRSKKEQKSSAIKIKSIQANSLYAVNNYVCDDKEETKKPYLDLGDGVINDSLFADYMKCHGMVVDKKGRSKDFIVMKFDYGVKNVMSSQALRTYYYENGATVNIPIYNKDGVIKAKETIRYKMLMRNPGKAKEGDCIFVKEDLHETALKYITMNLWDKMPMDNANIVEMSAYAPLTTATAIDYITIPMENIFIVKDEEVAAFVNAVSVKMQEVTYSKEVIDWDKTEEYINTLGFTFYKKIAKNNANLSYIKKTKSSLENNGICIENCPIMSEQFEKKESYVERSNEKAKVTNTLWDGMGILDESIFPQDSNMDGFIYCRNHFFKSCLFRGNIQEYFKNWCKESDYDYETYQVQDMFGNIFKIKDIKVIITDKSIKWIKFKELMEENGKTAYEYYRDFLKQHKERFEIVKTAHSSKWGHLQRSSYQMNNSYPCVDKEKLTQIAQPSVDYCNELKINHESYIKHLRMSSSKRYSINNVLVALDEWNDNFKNTQYFKSKRASIISDFKNKRLKLGKLLQYGDNLTICGNPIALLMKVTGQDFLGEGCFEIMEDAIQCYTTRFKDGERLAGFRSPHNSPNNIVHLFNNRSELIARYFPKLGDNVIIINGIGTDVQSRLNGQDLDTDSIYTTNQPEIVELAKYSYLNYPTIINDIPLVGKSVYKKDMESYAEMDNKISSSQNATGEASNIAQLALSYYYDGGGVNKGLEDVFIICSVLAQISIDGAKRRYDIDVNYELNRLKQWSCMKMEDGKKYPEFYAQIQRLKKLKNGKKKEIKNEKVRKFNCPMEILADIIEENVIDIRKYKRYAIPTYDLNTVFQYKPDKIRDGKQYKKVISIVQNYDKEVKELDETKEDYSENVEIAFEDCMRKINKLTINKSTMSSLIAYAFNNNGDIRDRLLVTLYDRDTEKFLSCFKKTEKTPLKNAESLENKGIEIFAYEEGHERNVG